jgi:hypothetical protein
MSGKERRNVRGCGGSRRFRLVGEEKGSFSSLFPIEVWRF